MRAIISSLWSIANCSLTTTTAAAPSLRVDAFPAVTVSSSLLSLPGNAGRSFASDSTVVSFRGPSSVSIVVVPFRPAISTGVISALNFPVSIAAIETGKFKAEITPVEIAGRKGTTTIDTDEGPRKDTTVESLAKLRPAFPGKDKSEELTVTAGNASTLNDGAAAVVVVSEQFAIDHKLEIMARITGYATGGGEPQDLFFAPIVAVEKLMAKTAAKIGDYDLIEANEAFASQSIADARGLAWDTARVNVNGGAIALGHPLGASGARILTTLLYALKDRGKRTGLATLCLGGGNAVAMSVERP